MRQKIALADVIIHNLSALIEDPFGNYLVQNVLKLDNAQKSDMIFRVITKDFVRLSQLKFSSNVIEKCLDSAKIGTQVDQLFNGTHENEDVTIARCLGKQTKNKQARLKFLTQRLMMHSFGNYVLQKAILVVNPGLRTQILESIQLQSSSLAQTKHGPKVLQKLQKQYPHIFSGPCAASCQAEYKGSMEPGADNSSSSAGGPARYVNKNKLNYQKVSNECGQLNVNS
jgi:hypothetical protein